MPIKGNAGIVYNAGAGDVTVQLNIPLFRASPGTFTRRHVRESDDGTAFEVLKSRTTPLYEVAASLRFIDDPVAVLAWLEWALDMHTFRYVPDLGTPASEIPSLVLISPRANSVRLPREAARMSRGETSLDVVWRRTDGGTFALLPGMNL